MHPNYKDLANQYGIDAKCVAEVIVSYRMNFTKPPLLVDIQEELGFSLQLAVCTGVYTCFQVY